MNITTDDLKAFLEYTDRKYAVYMPTPKELLSELIMFVEDK